MQVDKKKNQNQKGLTFCFIHFVQGLDAFESEGVLLQFHSLCPRRKFWACLCIFLFLCSVFVPLRLLLLWSVCLFVCLVFTFVCVGVGVGAWGVCVVCVSVSFL